VIRYYLNESIPTLAAARCEHPALARLRGRGPWTAIDGTGVACVQRGQAAAWGEIRDGLGGLRYQLASEMPDLMSAIRVNATGPIAWVTLRDGIRLPVRLAAYAPVCIGLDGQPDGMADDYGAAATRIWDRMQSGPVGVTDPELVAFARRALMTCTDLTDELCHAFRLITTDSVQAILDAATGCDSKKVAPPGDGG
jgi:hypothetical protein